jgi:hypothetical protein
MSSDDEYAYDSNDDYEYEDPDEVRKQKEAAEVRSRLAQLEGVMMKLVDVADKGRTPEGLKMLSEAQTLLRPLYSAPGIDADAIHRTLMAFREQMNRPVRLTASDEDMARLCEADADKSMPCYESTGAVRISVPHPVTGMRHCVCYDARELAEHVRNHGWTDPKFKTPLSLEQQARIIRALKRISNGCFSTQNDETVLYEMLGELNVMPSGDVSLGKASVPGELYERILRSADEAGVPNIVLRVSSHNSAVFVTPEPRENSRFTTVMLSLQDYNQLGKHGDDTFEGHLAILPVATSITLDRDDVDMHDLSTMLDTLHVALLRVGDVYKVDGKPVTIMDMKPACATIRPGIGTVAEIEVLVAASEEGAASGSSAGAGFRAGSGSGSGSSASAAAGGRARFRHSLTSHQRQREHVRSTGHHDAMHRSLHGSGGLSRSFASRYAVHDNPWKPAGLAYGAR